MVQYRDADGNRKHEFFETKDEANTLAEQKRIEFLNYGAKSLSIPNELRQEAVKAAELLKPFPGKTILEAARFFANHLKTIEKSCTISQLVDEFLQSKLGDGKSTRHLDDLRLRLARFAENFGARLVATVTAPECDDWLRSLNVAAQTRNNYRAALLNLFQYGKKRRYTQTNPVVDCDKAKVTGAEIQIFTVSEIESLLRAADTAFLPYLALGAFAGLRRAEIERLDWEEIDLAEGHIEVKAIKSKTAQRRFVKIEPCLAAWLEPLAKSHGKVVQGNIRDHMAKTCQQTGENGKTSCVKWKENGLRHSFASYHLAFFKDTSRLALELGHTSSALLFKHYRELVKPKEAALYWQIRSQEIS